MPYEYKYPRPGLTTDTVAFTILDDALSVALIKRGIEPFLGKWALPGGYVRENEAPAECAVREMSEETGYAIPFSYLSNFAIYGDAGRDPRGWIVSAAFYALVPQNQSSKLTLKPDSDAAEAEWFRLDALPELAFDHAQIVADAYSRLRTDVFGEDRVSRAEEVFGFLPEEFTIAQLRSTFEAIKGQPIDKKNFRKWITEAFELVDTGRKETGGRHRPAALFISNGPSR